MMDEAAKAMKEESAAAEKSANAYADLIDNLSAVTVQLRADALAQQDHNERIGLSKIAIAELDAKRFEHLASLKDEKAELAELIDWTGGMSQAYRDQAQALRERAGATRVGAAKEENLDVTRAKELLDIMTQVDEATRQAAAGMEASFGRVGAAIGGLTTALSGYGRAQAAIAAQLAADKVDPKNGAEKIAKLEIAAANASAQAKIKSYGDMAGAAKGFFKENTSGYKTMEKVERAFRAVEMAMALETMVRKIFFKEGEVAANVALNATKLTGEAATTAASTVLAAEESNEVPPQTDELYSGC